MGTGCSTVAGGQGVSPYLAFLRLFAPFFFLAVGILLQYQLCLGTL